MAGPEHGQGVQQKQYPAGSHARREIYDRGNHNDDDGDRNHCGQQRESDATRGPDTVYYLQHPTHRCEFGLPAHGLGCKN